MIAFLEDGEHCACSTAVNRGILIPDKDFLLLEIYCITEMPYIYTV